VFKNHRFRLWTKGAKIFELLPPRFCLVLIIAAIHDIMGDIVTAPKDLVEIDSLILDLEDRDYALSVNAYETLKSKCSHDWEAFK